MPRDNRERSNATALSKSGKQTLSSEAIDEWQQQVTQDFDYLYKSLRKREDEASKQNDSKVKPREKRGDIRHVANEQEHKKSSRNSCAKRESQNNIADDTGIYAH